MSSSVFLLDSREAVYEALKPYTTTALLLLASSAFVWIGSKFSITRQSPISKGNDEEGSIPWAPGAIPILGHALQYRKDPSGFLIQTAQTLQSPIFQVNMAGKCMILVCGPEAQRQVATCPESILSARHAVADIGFEQTLGNKNVHQGTNIHKGIIRGVFSNSNSDGTIHGAADRQVRVWRDALRRAFRQEIDVSQSSTFDFFQTIRRVMLRTTIDVMIGQAFLQDWTEYDFMCEFMSFQDALEDVTAKAVVLPKWLALPAMLWPIQRRRLVMQRKIEQRLRAVLQQQNVDDNGDIGFWLQEVRGEGSEQRDLSDIAEYIVGLLFAAHKNPAIGAAQSYLMLKELAPPMVLQQCVTESHNLMANPTWECLESFCPVLRRVCLETLRLTAHSIGAVRLAQEDVTITVGTSTRTVKLYKIPRGATVGLTHIATSLDTGTWGDKAATFNVEDDSHTAELYRDEYKFTVFSHGVHKCPGQQLALLTVEATVAILLTDYNVTLPDRIPPLSFERATLAQRAGPILASVTTAID